MFRVLSLTLTLPVVNTDRPTVLNELLASPSGRVLRRVSVAASLLGLWVRIQPETWMSGCCECCVLSGRGLCDGLITRLEESYRLWWVVVLCVVQVEVSASG